MTSLTPKLYHFENELIRFFGSFTEEKFSRMMDHAKTAHVTFRVIANIIRKVSTRSSYHLHIMRNQSKFDDWGINNQNCVGIYFENKVVRAFNETKRNGHRGSHEPSLSDGTNFYKDTCTRKCYVLNN